MLCCSNARSKNGNDDDATKADHERNSPTLLVEIVAWRSFIYFFIRYQTVIVLLFTVIIVTCVYLQIEIVWEFSIPDSPFPKSKQSVLPAFCARIHCQCLCCSKPEVVNSYSTVLYLANIRHHNLNTNQSWVHFNNQYPFGVSERQMHDRTVATAGILAWNRTRSS